MSANNYILIKENPEGFYDVSDRDFESNGKNRDIGSYRAIRQAIEKAELYIKSNELMVEYGIRFSLLSKQNDFDKWNDIKKNIQNIEDEVLFFPKKGEVWMCSVGRNVGFEQNGGGDNFSRPVLIIRKINNHMFLAIPLSTKQKKYDFYYNFIDPQKEPVSAILAQIRLFSVKRFTRKLYEINSVDFTEILIRIKKFFP